MSVLCLLGSTLIMVLGNKALARILALPVERSVQNTQRTTDVVVGDFYVNINEKKNV
jgi:hypothetical protein